MVKPFGGKYGFGDKIRLAREFNGGDVIAGLLDRDFDADDSPPTQSPRPWRVENNTLWLGWRWERKEIENYLLDPRVVQQVLANRAPAPTDYDHALQNAANHMIHYTAARTALSCVRPRFSPLRNEWENARNINDLSELACRSGIRQVIASYAEQQIVSEESALQLFESFLPQCRPGGRRFEHFLMFFAGKDLLRGLEPGIQSLGFANCAVFKEKVLKGIEEAQSDVWMWLPEWQALRQQILTSQ